MAGISLVLTADTLRAWAAQRKHTVPSLTCKSACQKLLDGGIQCLSVSNGAGSLSFLPYDRLFFKGKAWSNKSTANCYCEDSNYCVIIEM